MSNGQLGVNREVTGRGRDCGNLESTCPAPRWQPGPSTSQLLPGGDVNAAWPELLVVLEESDIQILGEISFFSPNVYNLFKSCKLLCGQIWPTGQELTTSGLEECCTWENLNLML